jgi:hypothetical protein
MNIYFDTEFEGLTEHPNLISIGFISENQKESFYAELTDTYQIENCNDFCKKIVLPLLDSEQKYSMTFTQLQDNLYNWLSQFQKKITLICDSERDIYQMNIIFPHGLPSNCEIQLLGFFSQWKRRIYNYKDRIHKKYHLRPHHALDDAIVNQIIFEFY